MRENVSELAHPEARFGSVGVKGNLWLLTVLEVWSVGASELGFLTKS